MLIRPYLIASCTNGNEIRLYALQRFKKVEITEKNVTPLIDFSLDSYISNGNLNFGVAADITLRAKVSESLASYLYETPLGKEQKIRYKDGAYIVSARVKDSWQLWFWILSQGASITVLSPKKLRINVAAELESAFENYAPFDKFKA